MLSFNVGLSTVKRALNVRSTYVWWPFGPNVNGNVNVIHLLFTRKRFFTCLAHFVRLGLAFGQPSRRKVS